MNSSNNKIIFNKISKAEEDTNSLAIEFAEFIKNTYQEKGSIVIYLDGNLGLGKTTFVRFFLRALGYIGFVKSPTFTIVESYEIPELNNFKVHHFDLYRLSDPEELEYIGIDEYFENSISFIEWPCHGEGFIRYSDYNIKISIEKQENQHVRNYVITKN